MLEKSMAPTKDKVSNNIPDDLIIFHILSKLPVKSLKRFSCVRKSWANLLENPQFLNIYRTNFLSKHENDNSCLILKQIMPNTHQDGLFLLSGERFENRVQLDWLPPFQENNNFISNLGSAVNGTLCLYQSGSGPAPEIGLKAVLWNPSTEEFKVIPPGSVDYPLGVDIDVLLNGFGYDPVTDDYKLIRYVWFTLDWYGYDFRVDIPRTPDPLWQIYSLRSNCWRKLDVEMPFNAGSQHICFLNGMCHWIGYCPESGQSEWMLVSFSLSDEVFHTTPLDGNDCCELRPRPLVVMNDSIAMITMYAGTACFDIFVLGELGVKKSWTKMFSIGPLPCVDADFIGLGRKGDMFFVIDDDQLVCFDLSTQKVQEIGVRRSNIISSQIIIYEESLLPIGGINS